MKMEVQGDTLKISAIKQLGATNANAFRDWVAESVSEANKNIDLDLSQTSHLDSCGLGVLIALQKTAARHCGALRLLHPQPPVQQILELTRMDRVFHIVKP